MERQDHQLPTADEIKNTVLSELRYHRERSPDEDITSYVDAERLIHAAGGLMRTDLDPELEWKLKCRTKAVLRRLEKDGLVAHWVSENWYLTDVGAQYR